MTTNIGALLEQARRRNFIGRTDELAGFDAALAGRTTRRVLIVHGPGGIGKTTLLHELRSRAADASRPAVAIDGRDIDAAPATFEAQILASFPEATEVGEIAGLVLLVDGYELLGGLDGWMRTELLPALAADAVVVLAGREPPPSAWRSDSGWRELVAIEVLPPLDPDESRELLRRAGLGGAAVGRLVELGHGHPLALALLADVALAGELPERLADSPDLVTELVQVLVAEVPDDDHAMGLATCAHSWITTEDLLRATVGDAAPAVWTWLESRPFVVRGPNGLYLHDLARDVLEAEFRRRSPDAYRRLHRTIRNGFTMAVRIGDAEARPQAAEQIMFLHRTSPISAMVHALRSTGAATVVPGQPADGAEVQELIRSAQGDEAAGVCRRWLADQPESLWVVRGDDHLLSAAVHLVLPSGSPLEDDDPVVRRVLDHVANTSPARPGEMVTVARHVAGAREGVRDPHAVLVGSVSSVLLWFRLPLAWSWIVSTDGEFWGPICNYLAFTERVEIDGERRTVAWGMDWRRLDVDSWFDLMGERELTGAGGPPPPELLRPPALGRDTFARALRAALADLRRLDVLAGSPLIGSRLAAGPDGASAAQLVATIEGAIGVLAGQPKDAPLARVLDRTYRHGTLTQEAAAEVLDMAFSTYRRHLAKAHERLCDVLWAIEIGELRLPVDGV